MVEKQICLFCGCVPAKPTIEQQCAQAMARIVEQIEAQCSKHKRAIRKAFKDARGGL